jgi:hypothetical protein
MTEKIVIPEGMLEAVCAELHHIPPSENVGYVLEAALRWLSENPIAPTNEQARVLFESWWSKDTSTAQTMKLIALEWQRLMFLPVPEFLPSELISMIHGQNAWTPADVLKAYRLGQKSAK